MCDGLSSAGFAWSGRKRNGETSAMMSFHSESGRGPGLSDKSHVFPPAFDTGHRLRLSTGRPWQSLLNAVSAARTRSPAVAEAIGDHGKLPKRRAAARHQNHVFVGEARWNERAGISPILVGDSFASGRQKV